MWPGHVFMRFNHLLMIFFMTLVFREGLHVHISVVCQGQGFQSIIILSSLRFIWLFAEDKRMMQLSLSKPWMFNTDCVQFILWENTFYITQTQYILYMHLHVMAYDTKMKSWNMCKKKQDEEKSWWSVIFHYSYDRCKMMCKAVGLH